MINLPKKNCLYNSVIFVELIWDSQGYYPHGYLE